MFVPIFLVIIFRIAVASVYLVIAEFLPVTGIIRLGELIPEGCQIIFLRRFLLVDFVSDVRHESQYVEIVIRSFRLLETRSWEILLVVGVVRDGSREARDKGRIVDDGGFYGGVLGYRPSVGLLRGSENLDVSWRRLESVLMRVIVVGYRVV